MNNQEKRSENRKLVEKISEPGQDLVRACCLHASQIQEVSEEIDNLAYHFKALGNKEIASKLLIWAEELLEMSGMILKALYNNSDQELKNAQESTSNMFKFAVGLGELLADAANTATAPVSPRISSAEQDKEKRRV